MKKVIILGASGGLAKHVIGELQIMGNLQLTLFLRNKNTMK
jgi:hypothetical protein